MNIDFRKGDRI